MEQVSLQNLLSGVSRPEDEGVLSLVWGKPGKEEGAES